MKTRLWIAWTLAIAGFGLPWLGISLDLFAITVFMSLGLSLVWSFVAVLLITDHRKRGLWILFSAPLAFFWWLPMIFPIV